MHSADPIETPLGETLEGYDRTAQGRAWIKMFGKAQRPLGVDCRAKGPITVEVGDKVKESFGVGRAPKRGHKRGLHRNTVMKIDYTIGTWLSSVFSNE